MHGHLEMQMSINQIPFDTVPVLPAFTTSCAFSEVQCVIAAFQHIHLGAFIPDLNSALIPILYRDQTVNK